MVAFIESPSTESSGIMKQKKTEPQLRTYVPSPRVKGMFEIVSSIKLTK